MKRRNADLSKLRRPLKRTKIGDGVYGSAFSYLKMVLLWSGVLACDFLFELRFEYFWPLWMFSRSVYESFRYQGIAFSLLFVLLTLTSDMVCYIFVPVHWLFFAASTYVWVQYVWYAERGICLPTLSLWILFIYIEACLRLKHDDKHLFFHADFSQPFAAHCIGYPVVTLGFSVNSYISHRLRLRRQKLVAGHNCSLFRLVLDAPLAATSTAAAVTDTATSADDPKRQALSELTEDSPSVLLALQQQQQQQHWSSSPSSSPTSSLSSSLSSPLASSSLSASVTTTSVAVSSAAAAVVTTTTLANGGASADSTLHRSVCTSASSSAGAKCRLQNSAASAAEVEFIENKRNSSVNEFDEADDKEKNYKNAAHSQRTSKWNGSGGGAKDRKSRAKDSTCSTGSASAASSTASPTSNSSTVKDDAFSKLEADLKRLRAELNASRQLEHELRCQTSNLSAQERSARTQLSQLQLQHEQLQNKLHQLVGGRQQDRQTIAGHEKRLADEKRQRQAAEAQTQAERKKVSELTHKLSVENKARLREAEAETRQLRRENKQYEDRVRSAEGELKSIREIRDNQADSEVLMSALTALQEKNQYLEKSLSSETRIKMDLFAALGDAKRQLEANKSLLSCREREVAELNSKLADVLAVAPLSTAAAVCSGSSALCASPSVTSVSAAAGAGACVNGFPRLDVSVSGGFLPSVNGFERRVTRAASAVVGSGSPLDPNAAVYTPTKLA